MSLAGPPLCLPLQLPARMGSRGQAWPAYRARGPSEQLPPRDSSEPTSLMITLSPTRRPSSSYRVRGWQISDKLWKGKAGREVTGVVPGDSTGQILNFTSFALLNTPCPGLSPSFDSGAGELFPAVGDKLLLTPGDKLRAA